MDLERVDWGRAIDELRVAARAGGAAARRRLADASSLSALFEGDFRVGSARLADALRLEPLNPLHHLRRALHALRFGAFDLALTSAEVVSAVEDPPYPQLLRALATLQSGEDRRAANVARDLYGAKPAFHLAGFLQAEAQVTAQPKEAETRAQSLPRDPAWAAAWARLLGRFMMARPGDAARIGKQHLEVRPALAAGSREEKAIRKLLRWCAADAEALARELAEAAPGSRAEELILELVMEAHRATERDGSRLTALRRLHERAPERAALRRVYVSALTRFAVDEAAAERWASALRAIEVCMRLEPHQTMHLQNRAAIVTALVDDAYHEAWEDLERHQYRLALLGRLDPAGARAILKPHRMFAQQARLTPEGSVPLGVFRVQEERENGVTNRSLVVNQARLEGDPEQLRQWVHHRRAELVFSHLTLGWDPERHLLHPGDARTERARIDALTRGAASLGTLVEGEGAHLAELLAARWRSLEKLTRTRYDDKAPDDPEAAALLRQYADTFADLGLVLWTYLPPADRPDIVDELLDFLASVTPFLDARALRAARKETAEGPPRAHGFLAAILRQTLDLPEEDAPLGDAQRQKVANRLAAEVLVTLAARKLEAAKGLEARDVDGLLAIVDRARQIDPENAKVECWAARLLTIGELYDEARAAVARFHRVAGGKENAFQKHIEEIQRILDEKKKAAAPGRKRSGAAASAGADGPDFRREQLEEQVERFPTSIALYEELCRKLAFEGRFDEALTWTGRAIGRCLSRAGQIRARTLQLEVTGLRALAPARPEAPRIYLAGSRAAALEGIEAVAAQATELPYAVEYLRGMCLLAARRREEAQAAFRAALARCPQQLYRAVLRPLADDVEVALLDQARRTVELAEQGGRLGDALGEIATAMAELRAPEALLLDLARVGFASVVETLGKGADAVPLPALRVSAPWSARLEQARALPDGLARARAVATLSAAIHEGSKREAEALLRKMDALGAQLALAAAVSASAQLAERGQVTEALATLDAAGEAAAVDPRACRQRALLLLRLERIADADAVVAALQGSEDPRAREMVERYPDLRFRFQLPAANRLLRGGDPRAARALLDGMHPATPEQALEHAYCRAFCLAQEGYHSLDDGEREEARAHFTRALELLDERLPEARRAGHARLVELHEKLDADVARL